jgi:hypothetical protein
MYWHLIEKTGLTYVFTFCQNLFCLNTLNIANLGKGQPKGQFGLPCLHGSLKLVLLPLSVFTATGFTFHFYIKLYQQHAESVGMPAAAAVSRTN